MLPFPARSGADPQDAGRGLSGVAVAAIAAAHAALVLFLFHPQLLQGRVPFFRDLSSQYYPEYVFVANALRDGVWPLWNPGLDGGTRFLLAYPPDLLLLRWLGALPTLVLEAPLHVLLAAAGASFLARTRGAGWYGAWAAGACYGCSGVVLSCANLIQLLQAAAWAPWVLAALVRACDRPGPRRLAVLALLAALQVSTLAADVVLQTAIVAAFLVPWRRARAWVPAVAGAAVLTAVLAAPALLGARALLEGSQRARGFGDELFGWSASGAVLLESVVPRLFGDVHTLTDLGFWGQHHYTGGYPFLISLYVGLGFSILTLHAPRRARVWWAVALLGVCLAAGEHGPFQAVLRHLPMLRTPVKYFWLTTLAVSMLAAHGLDAALDAPRALVARWSWVVPLPLFAVGAALLAWPAHVAPWLGSVLPPLADPLAQDVVRRLWPQAFCISGALAILCAVALGRGGRLAALGGLLAALELLLVNANLNTSTGREFYALSAPMQGLLRTARDEGGGRLFTYGAVNSPGLRWAPGVLRTNSDVWLFYADRQTLWSRTAALDGFEPAFGEDRTGAAAEGATLPAGFLPSDFSLHHERLREGGVRWVLSFHDLPPELAAERGRAALGFLENPVRLYELRGALPRALFVPGYERVDDLALQRARVEHEGFDPRVAVLLADDPPAPALQAVPHAEAEVRYEARGPHEVLLHARTPPGFLLVLDQFDRAWRVDGGTPLLRGNFRYWALPTRGGAAEFVVRFRPGWRAPALALLALGAVAAAALVLWPVRALRRRLDNPSSSALASAN